MIVHTTCVREGRAPGEVFGLGLEETRGDIGAALLISHNTLRSLARACGDDLRTGIRALDSGRFDKLFITRRPHPGRQPLGPHRQRAGTMLPRVLPHELAGARPGERVHQPLGHRRGRRAPDGAAVDGRLRPGGPLRLSCTRSSSP